jgi:hypothetical protein
MTRTCIRSTYVLLNEYYCLQYVCEQYMQTYMRRDETEEYKRMWQPTQISLLRDRVMRRKVTYDPSSVSLLR